MTESPKEKTDRQLVELFNELRVVMPGAQVLLGFMLAVPFATRFGRTSEFDRGLLFACIVVTATGALLLMAPSVYHRVRWNEGGKQDVVRVGHRLFLVGTLCLGLGMLLAVLLVGDVLFGLAAAIPTVAIIAGVVAVTWYVLPLSRGRSERVRDEE